jgi:hypothetical protein
MTVVSQHQRAEAAVMKLSVSVLGARRGESGGMRQHGEALGALDALFIGQDGEVRGRGRQDGGGRG